MNSNASHVNYHSFILTGIPGMPDKNPWMAFPLGFLYILTLLGNATILAVIKVDHSLHEPMYYFLSILAVTDVSLSMSTLPSMLSIFWFNALEISFNACITQMFFIHGLVWMEWVGKGHQCACGFFPSSNVGCQTSASWPLFLHHCHWDQSQSVSPQFPGTRCCSFP